jgi:hypothetical protein
VWQSADPILGKYLTGEPNAGVYDPVNLALYSYTGNNPMIYVDPDGRMRWGDAFTSVLGIASNAAGIAVGGALVTGGVALVGVPEPTMLTKVAGVATIGLGGTVLTKSVAGVALNATNLCAAIEDKDPYVPSSAAQVIAESIAPGNKTAKGVADAADLTLDLVSGRAPAGSFVNDLGKTVPGNFNKIQDMKAAQARVQGTPLIATEVTGASKTSTAVDTLQGLSTTQTALDNLPKTDNP